MTITYAVADRQLTTQYTAVVRAELRIDQLPAWFPEAYRDVHEYLQRIEMVPAGPPFARYTFLGDLAAVEAGFPVSGEVPGEGTIVPSVLPDGPAAVTVHIGPYEGLGGAYEAVVRWLDAHGREPADPHWEIYHTDPNAEPDPMRWRTEVVVPYRGR